jgi:hypothetical protein
MSFPSERCTAEVTDLVLDPVAIAESKLWKTTFGRGLNYQIVQI